MQSSTGPVISTHGLTKRYKKTLALQGVDLDVPRGSCFGLLGPNGAGKSTLVKTLLGLVHPTSGTATLLGQDIASPEARRGVGYLPEGHQFPKYLTGRGVCRYFGKLAGGRGPELERDIDHKLDLVGMTDRANDKIKTYSKGMKQRVGLAQAMLGSPKVIFLDEPTDGVDPVGRKEIRAVIADIGKEGVTVFLNSHLLSEVEMICDQVAIMNHGELLVRGSVDEIKAHMNATDGGVSVVFRTAVAPSELPAALWTSLEGRGAIAVEERSFQLQLGAIDDVTGVIDELRGAGVAIHAVQPHESSLEDAFVDLIRGKTTSEEASDV